MRTRTVLHIDDDPNDAYFLQQALGVSGTKVRVQSAESAAQAVDYLAGHGPYADRSKFPLPDLILLDIKMPAMDGFEFLAWLRRQDEYKALPVFMLSASDAPRDIARAKELGANGYLVKYIGFMGVADAVAKALAPLDFEAT